METMDALRHMEEELKQQAVADGKRYYMLLTSMSSCVVYKYSL